MSKEVFAVSNDDYFSFTSDYENDCSLFNNSVIATLQQAYNAAQQGGNVCATQKDECGAFIKKQDIVDLNKNVPEDEFQKFYMQFYVGDSNVDDYINQDLKIEQDEEPDLPYLGVSLGKRIMASRRFARNILCFGVKPDPEDAKKDNLTVIPFNGDHWSLNDMLNKNNSSQQGGLSTIQLVLIIIVVLLVVGVLGKLLYDRFRK